MNGQIERCDPEQLPFQIEDELGEIKTAHQPYPGVYYIAAQKNETKILVSEYYIIIKDTPSFRRRSRTMGRQFPDTRSYWRTPWRTTKAAGGL